jgi:hypothetical protein
MTGVWQTIGGVRGLVAWTGVALSAVAVSVYLGHLGGILMLLLGTLVANKLIRRKVNAGSKDPAS